MASASPDSASPLPRRLLPALLLLSGFCGISYEILYTKLLGNLLGSQFTVNATVLLTFLAGIGIGALYAHRFSKYLPAIEAGIGIYAALMAVLYELLDHFIYATVPFLGTNIYAAAIVSLALLVVPAFLVGCSLPLFAAYLSTLRSSHVFSATYGIYNVGAGLTALAMEFVLLRAVGIRAATFTLALLNGVVALGLIYLMKRASIVPSPPKQRIKFPKSVTISLVVASIASAVFQLLMIKIAEFVFGPYNETFALVLAAVLFGIAIGAAAAARFDVSFTNALLLSLGGLVWLLSIVPSALTAYAIMYPGAVKTYLFLVLLKFGLVVLLMGLPSVGFGATIPALLKKHKDVAQESGQLLFCSSMANAFGFLLMAFVLHQYLDYGPIIVFISTLTAAAIVIHNLKGQRVPWIAVGMVVLSVIAYKSFWQETLLYVGHKTFHSLEELEKETSERLYADKFKGPQDVFAITWKHGKPYFFINGYISIALNSSAETLVGAMSSMLSPRMDDALVLGVGSGATAGAVGLLFQHTDAVEINRVVLQNLNKMSEYNHGIEENANVDIIHDDGIHFIKTTPKKYSLILNTVTTPLYFSSSKLYTKDFFQHVSHRLKPDGIYTTWIDGRIGDHGVNIILETLKSTFKECWIYYIKSSYFTVVCSNGKIGFGDLEAVTRNEALRDYLEKEHHIPIRVLPYSVFSTNAYSFKSPEPVPVNTLDFPVLEFAMARLPTDRMQAFKGRLKSMDLRSVAAEANEVMDWRPEEYLFLLDWRIGKRRDLYVSSLQAIGRQFGMITPELYNNTVLRFAEEIGTAEAFVEFSDALVGGKDWEAAVSGLTRALELDPTVEDANYLLGRCYHNLDRYAEARTHYETAWELTRNPSVPMRIVKVLLELREYDEALGWLDTALAVDVDPERVSFYRGRCYEGKGDLDEARRQYQECLSAEPGAGRCRDALVRLQQ